MNAHALDSAHVLVPVVLVVIVVIVVVVVIIIVVVHVADDVHHGREERHDEGEEGQLGVGIPPRQSPVFTRPGRNQARLIHNKILSDPTTRLDPTLKISFSFMLLVQYFLICICRRKELHLRCAG